jgi:hypothetical protein
MTIEKLKPMCAGRNSGLLNESIEILKHKWANLWNEIIQSIADEEMSLYRNDQNRKFAVADQYEEPQR